jgi:hypothetical protein
MHELCLLAGGAAERMHVHLSAVSLGYISVYFSANACARFTRNKVNVARWFLLIASIGIVAIFYAFAMPR